MAQNDLDLASIFQAVTQSLAENQQTLNQSDEYNQDHGNNMVQTFQTITQALEQKKGSSNSTALAYAAQKLSDTATSTSGRIYAENLTQAASQFKGKSIDAQGALSLLQTLIGSGQTGSQAGQQSGGGASSQGGDMLGALLGGMTGGESSAQPSSQGGDMLGALLGGMTGGESTGQPTSQGGDMLGSLLGGLTGGQSSSSGGQGQGGFGLGNLLNAGMAYFQAKQSGGDTMQALVQAFAASSGMGNTPHREQSTQLVVNAFLQALSAKTGQ